MSDSYKPHRPTAKRLLTQIGSRYALSNQVMVFFLIPAYGTGLIFESLRLETDFLERFVVSTAGYLATIAVLFLARLGLKGKEQKSRPGYVLAAFLLSGFARGAVILFLDVLTGQHQVGEELFRLLGGPVFTFVTLTVSAVLASNYQRHRESLAALANERYRLQIRSAGIRAKVQIQREELLSKVRNLLDPAIARIRATLTGASSTEAINSLQSTVDDVVRPLSIEVAEASDELEAESGRALIGEKAPIPRRIMLGEFMVPLWAALIAGIVTVPVAFLVEELGNSLLIVFTIFLSLLLGLALIQSITLKIPVHPFLAAVLVPSFSALALTPVYFVAPMLEWQVSTQQIHALLLFGASVGATTFAAQFAQLQRKATTENLEAVNLQLEILNASLRQELWLNRRRTASVLHGPVQAALFASAMKLSQDQKPTPELVVEVEKDIQDALEKLNNPSNLEGENISLLLNQIIDIWSDAAEISIDIPEPLEQAITKAPLASEALIEISREFITNAIKHGKASNVALSAFRLDAFRIAIQVIDDGQGLPPGAKPGFGSKLLSELSLSWKQTRDGDRTISYAEIVLGDQNQQIS
jgi:signal transduction histidine kinase